MKLEIEKTIFSQPQGNVRGLVTAIVLREKNGKTKSFRLGHATLLVDASPALTVDLPKSGLNCADLFWIAGALKDFATAVEAADRQPPAAVAA